MPTQTGITANAMSRVSLCTIVREKLSSQFRGVVIEKNEEFQMAGLSDKRGGRTILVNFLSRGKHTVWNRFRAKEGLNGIGRRMQLIYCIREEISAREKRSAE